MASEVVEGIMAQLFSSLGPALMISMGYVDLGKWVATVEGGAHFGFDVVLLVLIFNCTAILCQYLSTCVGTATGKNLAEICSEEYCRVACIFLGAQAELSMIVSDITMILGIGHGLSFLFGMDLFASIFYSTVGIVLLPSFLVVLDNYKTEALCIGIAGFVLLFYVLGVLFSQPEVPLIISGISPRLNGDSAYSLMALLGANIMVHNFYVHSSIVKQKRLPNISLGASFNDHFFAILFIFTGISLVNYVLMNSAAAMFGSTDVFSFQDVSIVMDQIFRSPIAPLAFFLVLFFSSQVTALTRNIGREVILQCFFGLNLSWGHQALVKTLTIVPALYCAKSSGAEGIYQLLIFCQVILAMLLPSSVIPLFRVASSRLLMHDFRISWHLEILALVAFLVIFASNIFFVIEMLFGSNSWMINLTGSPDKVSMIPYIILLTIACASIGLTLHLAVTPLKSASGSPEIQIWTSTLEKDQSGLSNGLEDNDQNEITYDENQESSVENVLQKSVESQSEKPVIDSILDLPDTAIDSDNDSHQSAYSSSVSAVCMTLRRQPEELQSVVEADLLDTSIEASVRCLADMSIHERNDSNDPVAKNDGPKRNIHDRENEGDSFYPEDSFKRSLVSSTSELSRSNSINAKGLDGSNGSGSLSKLSGLGRAARRQLAAILDEFWGNLFDLHGYLTQEAAANRIDVLLGLDVRTIDSAKSDAIRIEASKSFFSDAEMGPAFPTNTRNYNSPRQMNNRNIELPFGIQMEPSGWLQNTRSLDSHVRSSPNNLVDTSEKLYSSLHLPQCSDSRDYQPATIHGYQVASYLREIGATRSPYSSGISQNLPPTPNPTTSSIATLSNQSLYSHTQNGLDALGSSSLLNPALPRVSRLQAEMPYYESQFGEASRIDVSSAYTKKYHSSPDISAIIALGRNAYLNEVNRGGPIGPRPSSGKIVPEQSQLLNTVSSTGVPLAFDQLSPPKLHRDVFGLSSGTKSLWARQPFEQLFGMAGKGQIGSDGGALERPSILSKEFFPYADSGIKLLQSLRSCIIKLLKLEGSDWLFKQNGGADEDIIDQIAASEKYLHRADTSEMDQLSSSEFQQLPSDKKISSLHRSEEADNPYFQPIPNCGDSCVWQAALVVSFGVWCIRRILELSLIESRPELWGKYTYVLNHLQGIIEPAFLKPRQPLSPCICLQTSRGNMWNVNPSLQNELLRPKEKPSIKSLTTASMIAELIKDIEIAVSCRKGRTGTVAGDVAFPKGKENLASVLKRYKRRLVNNSSGTREASSSSRRIPSSASSSVF